HTSPPRRSAATEPRPGRGARRSRPARGGGGRGSGSARPRCTPPSARRSRPAAARSAGGGARAEETWRPPANAPRGTRPPRARERAGPRLRHVARLDEARAERVDPRRLGRRAAELGREPFCAPAELGRTLPQLPRVPHEVDTLGGDPDLLEPRRLGAVALRGEGLAMALEGGGERVRRPRALHGEPRRLGERLPPGLALADDGAEPIRGRAGLLVKPKRLLGELTELDAHLLASLEQPLELALYLLTRLAEVREPMVALLESLALLRLLRRQLGGARPERLLLVAQAAELRRPPLALGDARHVLGREDHEREVALRGLERLVLLRLLRLPLERGELALDL